MIGRFSVYFYEIEMDTKISGSLFAADDIYVMLWSITPMPLYKSLIIFLLWGVGVRNIAYFEKKSSVLYRTPIYIEIKLNTGASSRFKH